jgi:hypothetical protein
MRGWLDQRPVGLIQRKAAQGKVVKIAHIENLFLSDLWSVRCTRMGKRVHSLVINETWSGRLGARVIHRAAEQLAPRFNSERVAFSIASHGPELSALQDVLRRAHDRATEALVTMHRPHLPSREQFLREARIMFSRTVSLEEIVEPRLPAPSPLG